MHDMCKLLDFDAQGRPTSEKGEIMDAAAVGRLPPALRLQAAGAIALHERAERSGRSLAVVDEWPPKKRKETHINLSVQRRSRDKAAMWQARLGVTRAYSLDGGWDDVMLETTKERRTSCAWIDEDGREGGGGY